MDKLPAAQSGSARPTVSIIVPCYNYGRFLKEAIESALGQTRHADEIIVIDDGSTDCTSDVLDRYVQHPHLHVIRQANQGAIAAFNRGIRASHGAFFVLLSADDRLDLRFLERTLPVLAANPAAGFAYTAYRVFGARHRMRPALTFSRSRLARRPYFTASALIRRQAFDAVGGFSDELAIGYEDWDLFLGLAELGWAGIAVPEALFHYRQHRVASRNSMSFRTWLDLLSRLFRRHRSLHRAPLPAFLCGAIAEQYWLTLRAAPRAALRRLGARPPAASEPGFCIVAESAADIEFARRAMHPSPVPILRPDAANDSSRTRGAWRAGRHASALARWALRARRQRAAVYHATGPGALLPAAVAAAANRALLIYEAQPCEAPPAGRLRRILARIAVARIDALLTPDRETAARWDRAFGVQPTLCYAPDGPDDHRIDTRRLALLYDDLLALYRPAAPDAERS